MIELLLPLWIGLVRVKTTNDLLECKVVVVAYVIAKFVVSFDVVEIVLYILLGLTLESVEYGRADE